MSARSVSRPARRRTAAKPKRKVAAKPKRAAAATRTPAPKPKRKVAAKPTRKVAAKPRPKVAAGRPPAARPARPKPPAKRPAPAPRPPARPRRAPSSAPPPPAFAAQRATASRKQTILFELERGRVAVQAAIQGMTAASAEQPIAPGKWSPRQIVLHLAFWDRFMLNALPFALHQNEAPDWESMDTDAVNAQGLRLYGDVDWEEARRLLDRTREELRTALSAIPEEPAEVWTREFAVGRLFDGFDGHDRHHAAQIKAFRVSVAVGTRRPRRENVEV